MLAKLAQIKDDKTIFKIQYRSTGLPSIKSLVDTHIRPAIAESRSRSSSKRKSAKEQEAVLLRAARDLVKASRKGELKEGTYTMLDDPKFGGLGLNPDQNYYIKDVVTDQIKSFDPENVTVLVINRTKYYI